MTKEEYKNLLNSDYWKGYSYSLIKERNFTCEDCGRTFYNERNKLQVHHLLYRDVNPWSYKPEELVVLCEECHKKRHGIENNDTTQEADANESCKYQSDSENIYSQEKDDTNKKKIYYYPNRNKHSYRVSGKNNPFTFNYPYRKRKPNKIIRYLIGAIIVSVLILGILQHANKKTVAEEDQQENIVKEKSKSKKTRHKKGKKKKEKSTEDKSEVVNLEKDDFVEIEQDEKNKNLENINTQENTIEKIESDNSE